MGRWDSLYPHLLPHIARIVNLGIGIGLNADPMYLYPFSGTHYKKKQNSGNL